MGHSDEHADILGGPIRQNPNTGLWAYWAYIPFSVQLLLLAGLGSLAVYCYIRIREAVINYQELNHRKASRRKHGIPDNDHRPFAVAYRAAMRARAEREALERRAGMSAGPASKQQPVPETTRNAIGDARTMRQRLINQNTDRHSSPLRTAAPAPELPRSRLVSFEDIQPPSRRSGAMPSAWPSSHRQGSHHLVRQSSATIRDGARAEKRSWADEGDVSAGAKRSRMAVQPSLDDDESRGWYERNDEHLARGSKRGFNADGDDHDYNNRDKRRRNESDQEIEDGEPETDIPMDEDEVDRVPELPSISRGKKRDRTEAGSTFGGDDEEDSSYNVNGKASRQAKRRSLAQRKSEAGQRGMKRDRDGWSPESDDDSEVTGRGRPRSHKKRGKRAPSPSEKGSSDVSTDTPASKDPLCKGRKIGDEWESNGVKYKVAENGERLRLTLVKKARSKYIMPQDSQHPDRAANMDIYVETWLTEEQYKEAEKRQELVGQDTIKPLSDTRMSKGVPGSPTKVGKSLLWDVAPSSPAPKRSLRQSIASDVGLRVNPFQQPAAVPTRRIASSNVSPVMPSPSRFRPFSKWEKQDMEAAAMARMRERMQEQKKAEPTALPAPAIPTSNGPALDAKPAVPAITFTAPTPSASTTEFGKPQNNVEAKPADANSAPGFSFAQPPVAAQIKEENKPATTPAPAFAFGPSASPAAAPAKPAITFGAPPAKEQSAQPSSFPPSVPSVPKEQTRSAPAPAAPPAFSFSQPSKPSAPAASNPPLQSFGAPSTPAPSTTESSAPKFSFSAPAGTTGAPGSAGQAQTNAAPASQSPSLFGSPSSGAPKPTLGGFGKPPAASIASPPVSNATQPASVFGSTAATPATAGNDKADSASQPKFSFGAIAPKVQTPVTKTDVTPATASTGALQEATKPAISAFSFSDQPQVAFGQPSSSDKGKASAALETKPEEAAKPMFSFSQPTLSPATTEVKPADADKPKHSFGQPAPTPTAVTRAKPAEANKAGFAFGQSGGFATSSSPSPFGTPASSTQPQSSGFSFGSGSTNAFGVTGSNDDKAKSSAPVSIFGAASKPAGQTTTATGGLSAFGFGAGTPTSAFGQNGASSAITTSTSAFGQTSTPGSTNAPASATPPGGFSFGVPNNNAFSVTPTGAPSATNGFTFGAPRPGVSGPSIKPAEAAKPFSAAPSTPVFAFGKQPESNSSTNGTAAAAPAAGSTPFTFGKPAGAPTTFSFGTPATGTASGSPFTFGQSNSQQK